MYCRRANAFLENHKCMICTLAKVELSTLFDRSMFAINPIIKPYNFRYHDSEISLSKSSIKTR